MLFETSGQRPGSKSPPPPVQPANVAGKDNTGIKNAFSTPPKSQANPRVNFTSSATQVNRPGTTGKIVATQKTVTPKSSYDAVKPLAQKSYTATTTNTQQAPVTGWPSQQQASKKPLVSTTTRPTGAAQKAPTATSSTTQQQARVTGWPSQQQASKKPLVSTATRPAGAAQKAPALTSFSSQQRTQVTGWPSEQQASKKPVVSTATRSAGAAQKAPTSTSFTSQQRTPVKGWPGRQQNWLKPGISTVAHTVPTQRVSRGTTTINLQKAPVTGWPGQQQSLRQQRPTYKPYYSSQVAASEKAIQPGSAPYRLHKSQRPVTYVTSRTNYGQYLTPQRRQQTVTGRQYPGSGGQRPITTTSVQKQQVYNAPVPGRTGPQGRRNRPYYTTTRNYVTNTGNMPQQQSYSYGHAAPSVQTSVVGWPSNRTSQSAPPPCDCSQCNGTTQSSFAHTAAPPIRATAPPITTTTRPVQLPVSPKPPICKTCGLKEKGCTTLPGFAINTALLTPNHKQQLRQLASSILQKNSNAVVATGYTNSSKQVNFF
jgi:hypothetical protein